MQSSVFVPIILVLATVALNTLAQTLLKLGSGQSFLNLYLLSGIVVYGLSTVFYILVLGKFNLSVAYPVIIGLTVASATVTGAWFLGEKIATAHWLGIGLMLSGISAIALGKH
jgi:multidrug transporter EmrE-like cation transporter